MATNTDLLRQLFKDKGMADEPKQVAQVPQEQVAQVQQVKDDTCVLFVSCHVVKGDLPILALDALKPLILEICAREKVPHISTIQYGRGYDMLNTMLMQNGRLPCSMQIDARSFEYQKIGATLEALADIVVRGV